MKFLSLAQLFGERNARSRVSGKELRRRSGRTRRRESLPLHLETLEDRSLLSTVPLPTPVPDIRAAVSSQPTGGTGGFAAPSTAIDPLDPNKLVTVYTQDGLGTPSAEPILVRGSYSIDGGQSWASFAIPGNLTDPTIVPPTPPAPLPNATDATVAFDRNENFYITYSEHKTDSSAGYIILQRFDFSGGSPAQTLANSKVYSWVGVDQVFHPTLAVDSNLPSDPDTGLVDPNAGNVYVSWSTSDTPPTGAVNFNPNSVKELISSDSGATFGPYKYLNTNTFSGGNGTPSVSLPNIAVSAGNAAKGVAAGQVTTVFDDFHSSNNSDNIDVALMKNKAYGQAFRSTGGAISDALAGTSPAPDTPVPTTFTQILTLPAGYNLTQLTLAVDVIDPNLTDLRIELYAPGMSLAGPGMIMIVNGIDSFGNTIMPAQGISGANMGLAPNFSSIGTVFDSTAPRSILDTAATPFVGHFIPESPFSLLSQNGKSFTSLSGTWTLKFTDVRSESGSGTPPVQSLVDWTIGIAGGFTTTETAVGTTSIKGALNAPYPLTTAASPTLGISPAPVIAADNTVGSFSVTKGNLYVAFVYRLPLPGTNNQADNTDIILYVSTNGGTTWTNPEPTPGVFNFVNNDYVDNDGLSEANYNPLISGYIHGRPQFSPELAVDQATGALVASWYDGRHDASRARVARYVGVSMDAGLSFSQTYANTAGSVYNPLTGLFEDGTAYDVITQGPRSFGPIPDNFSTNNPDTDAAFSYGEQEGLAVFGGNVVATWVANLNGGPTANKGATPDQIQRNYITSSHATFQAGPSVVQKDVTGRPLTTMGPITPSTATDLSGKTVTFNSTTTADGTPVFDGFVVYFDRPIDPSTLNASDISVFYRDVNTPGFIAGTPVTVTGVTPLFDESSTLATLSTPAQQSLFGASKYLISVAPQSGVGTYSYQIAPLVSDRIRHIDPTNVGGPLLSGNRMDQNADGTNGQTPFDYFAAPSPVNAAQSWTGAFFAPSYTPSTLPIIIEGPHLVGVSVAGQPATLDNLVLNSTTTSLDVLFDRNMDPSSFTGAQIVRLVGPAGAIGPNQAVPGSFSVTPNPNGTDPDAAHPRSFRINFLNVAGTKPQPLSINGTYSLVLAATIKDQSGDGLDSNLNAGVDTLRDTPIAGTTPITYNSTDVPKSVGSLSAANVVTDSVINVSDNYLFQHVTVEINVSYPRDPDLTITLIAPNGTRVTLVSGAGTTGNTANFISTVFDDLASTPINSGGPPFTGRFNPLQPLANLTSGGLFSSAGAWTLEIVTSQSGKLGTLNSWSLQLSKPLLSSGLGEGVSDQATASFRLFTMDPANPQSGNTWTNVGGQSNFDNNTGSKNSGPVGAIVVDPSDHSGNTVYIAGASGGVWKTTNFLTTSAEGPTYLPLTDFGPSFSLNVGSIAVFGRNQDPSQSEVFVGTGNPLPTPQATNLGVGFLRSLDGGNTWTLLDSSTNVDNNGNVLPMSAPQRDHIFVGLAVNKVVVDPRPTPTGKVIVYAAITDPAGVNGGIWRSLDGGDHWAKMIAGQATDVVLDPNSGHVNVISNPTGNLDVLFAALQGQGVFISPNRGQVWNQMLGQGGNPQIQDPNFIPRVPVPVNLPGSDPNTLPQGRIILGKPSLTGVFLPDGTYTGNPAQDVQYEGWLYVAVVSTNSTVSGLYLTKNFGLSWTRIRVPEAAPVFTDDLFVQSNDVGLGDADISKPSTVEPGRAAYDLTLAVNVNDPRIIYLGGLLNLRIDTTALHDAGAFYMASTLNDGGQLRDNSAGSVALKNWPNGLTSFFNPIDTPMINLFRNPTDVFNSSTSFGMSNVASVLNDGGAATWTLFDAGTSSLYDTVGTDSLDSYLQVVTTIDPTTGLTRLIFGKSNGVFSAVDDNGQVDLGTGEAQLPGVSRNGNLNVYEFFNSAAQPSDVAAQAANALFYASGFKNGIVQSDPNILTNGNVVWSGTTGSSTGVATDQTDTLFDGTKGSTVYRYLWPYQGALPNPSDFFATGSDAGGYISHTFGLIQTSNGGIVPDTQWPYLTGFDFAVNPIDGDQIDMVSNAGRVFATSNRGTTWLVIGDPQFLDGAVSQTQAFGAPQSTDPTGALNDYVLVGTNSGHIFVTYTGGGAAGNQWTNISTGLDGSEVMQIITDPTRNTRDAYAVTDKGIYFMADTLVSASNPTPSWINITGNIFGIQQTFFGPFAAAGPALTGNKLQSPVTGTGLASIAADWRYAIPDDPAEINNPTVPPGPTHPILYAAGSDGVFRSTDQGKTWTSYPDVADDGSPIDGGYLPSVQVTDLDIVLGNVDPTTGHPLITNKSANVLLATTFGRGDYAIRLAPQVVSESVQLDKTLPVPTGSQSGTSSGLPKVSILQPVFDGMSEQSAFGNTVTVNMYDLTDPNNPQLVGVSVVNPAQAFVNTDQTGRFQIQVKSGYFKSDGTTDGTKVFGFQVTDATGTVGPMTKFTFVLDTTPIIQASSVQFAAGSDSGRSATDKITNVIRPTIIGQVIQAAPETVQLVNVTDSTHPVVIGQGTTTASGSFSIQVNAGVFTSDGTTDGAKIIQVVALHVPNNSNSVLFNFTLDTTAPATPGAPSLLPTSDTGFSNTDHITNDTTPTFSGNGEANAIVLLYANGGSTAVGTDTVSAAGSYTVTVTNPLVKGTYNMTVQLVDVAGNASAMGPAMTPPLVIQTGAPSIPTLKLDPAFDTGTLGDNITAAIPAQFDGTTDPGTSVVIKDNGLQIDAFFQSATGPNTFSRLLNLADGVHTLVVQATDQANNVSTSSTLVITISSQSLDADSKFIRAIYQQALGRPGTIGEWNFWAQFLTSGNGRFTIANSIERSTEARTLTLDTWYQTYLGRAQAPKTSEIQFWLTAFSHGATEEQVLSSLLASAEYYNHAPTIPGVTGGTPSDSAFVQALFIQLLSRKASSSDIAFFTNLLPKIGRQQLALALLTSTEYRSDQVTIYYGPTLLGRSVPPSSQEVSGWVNSGLDLTSIRINFLASAEYFFRVTGLQA
jgi:subtilisin-like proprotein convertase family protein